MIVSRSVLKSTASVLALASICALLGVACGGGGRKGGTGGAAGASGAAGTNNGGANNGGANGSSGNSGTTGNSGTNGADGGGPVPGVGFGGNPTDGEVGARCVTNADCREELTCVPDTQDIGGDFGSPPGGWCTLPCNQAQQDMDCLALSQFSTCIRFNDGGTPDDTTDDVSYCMELCLPGSPLDATENKCHQRAELACLPVSPDIGFCVPACGSDADCGDRFCDLGSGTCVATAPAGDPIGSTCDATDDQCAGFCLQFTAETNGSSCSGACTFGIRGCGGDPESTDPATHLCLPDVNSLGVADIGVCLEACDCNTECSNPGNVCLPLQDTVLEEFYGRLGYCAPPFPPLTAADAGAPAADAGATDAGVAGDPFVTGLTTCP